MLKRPRWEMVLSKIGPKYFLYIGTVEDLVNYGCFEKRVYNIKAYIGYAKNLFKFSLISS